MELSLGRARDTMRRPSVHEIGSRREMRTRIDMPILSRGHQRIFTAALGDETGNTFCAGVPTINGKRPALAESGLDIDNDQCAAHEELLKRGGMMLPT